MNCEVCGETGSMPYTCNRCGQTFCVSHRLPESHDCGGLEVEKAHRATLREEGTEVPWFENDRPRSNNTAEKDPMPTLNTILLVLIILLATAGFAAFAISLIL